MPADSPTPDSPSALRVGLSAGKSLIGGLMLGIALAILLGFTATSSSVIRPLGPRVPVAA